MFKIVVFLIPVILSYNRKVTTNLRYNNFMDLLGEWEERFYLLILSLTKTVYGILKKSGKYKTSKKPNYTKCPKPTGRLL